MSPSRTNPAPWRPTRFVSVLESYDTSMGTTKIRIDSDTAYIKAMGNRQGPHALACEFVGTSLADWFGLSVPDYALFSLTADDRFPLPRDHWAEPGPAFVSRHVPGRTWGASATLLQKLENPDDITRLVVYDTWVRNCDRHPPDLEVRRPNYANVYLANSGSRATFRLLAIDHTHCFDCGRDLTPNLSDIDKIRDERTYGLFPEFRPYLSRNAAIWCQAKFRTLTQNDVESILDRIPPEWEVAHPAKVALANFILSRATWVADRIETGWPLA